MRRVQHVVLVEASAVLYTRLTRLEAFPCAASNCLAGHPLSRVTGESLHTTTITKHRLRDSRKIRTRECCACVHTADRKLLNSDSKCNSSTKSTQALSRWRCSSSSKSS